MRLRIDLHVLTTIFTLISSTNLQRSDASIKTVEEFLDTLINSSRYDRRIRPFFDQQSESISFPFVHDLLTISLMFIDRTVQCDNDDPY